MKCPNCGADMKEGDLYCEKCGKEIQIVPEFEPEIENSIHATLSNVATEITASGKGRKRTQKDKEWKKAEEKRKKKRRRMLFLIPAILLLIAAGILLTLHFMPGYQYKKALYYTQKEQYKKAVSGYQRAVELSPRNVSYLNGLAESYCRINESEKAAELCFEIISLEASNQDAYKRIVQIYAAQERYDEINALMQNCTDREIKNQYQDYMANPPELSMSGGTYQEIINIKLLSNTSGTIYYTLDGSDPDENSEVYTNPITLESGYYEVRAFFVNQHGTVSDEICEKFWIEVTEPDPPVVTPDSGIYSKPTQISVEVPEGCQVYYTTDRTDPDKNSTLYEGPFWMPVGYSNFRFMTVSPGGVEGSIVGRQYTLDLHPVLSVEAATNRLMLSLKNSGVLKDLQGNLSEKSGKNLYTYKYALTINDNHYYLFREYYEESAGLSNATGYEYVVNYISGECYRAEVLKDKSYKLYAVEALSEESDGN